VALLYLGVVQTRSLRRIISVLEHQQVLSSVVPELDRHRPGELAIEEKGHYGKRYCDAEHRIVLHENSNSRNCHHNNDDQEHALQEVIANGSGAGIVHSDRQSRSLPRLIDGTLQIELDPAVLIAQQKHGELFVSGFLAHYVRIG
jgi:hypothetical protein